MGVLVKAVFVVVLSYLLGSISFALLMGKGVYGIDLRERGSGNLGATNAFRVLGTLPGLLVFVGDILKGVLSVCLASYLFPCTPTLISRSACFSRVDASVVVLAGLAAIVGHNWSIYLKFSGGKGIATSAGVLLILFPKIVLFLSLIWFVIFMATRYISLGSVTIAFIFPFLVLYFHGENLPYVFFSIAAAVAVIYKHRSNLERLLKGEEAKTDVFSKLRGRG
ncbi:MAG TPA: acyl-phosphate glycerol 3-phosphate acyltransferase [Actinobacteria bacterium]|nr:acyl-phosphate glycerol 3-phosphate acyltransferase [Actinomycetota bacterium]